MTIYDSIRKHLYSHPKGVFGGTLERYASPDHKPSTVSRRVRELVEDGVVKVSYVKVPKVHNKVAHYTLSERARRAMGKE